MSVPDVLYGNAVGQVKLDAEFPYIPMNPCCRSCVNVKLRQQGVPGGALRVTVEHTLAHIGQWQGDRARYLGSRKNLFDLRRMAVVHNLHVIARMPDPAKEEAA